MPSERPGLVTHLWFWLTIYTPSLARPLLWRVPLSWSDRDAGRQSCSPELCRRKQGDNPYKTWQSHCMLSFALELVYFHRARPVSSESDPVICTLLWCLLFIFRVEQIGFFPLHNYYLVIALLIKCSGCITQLQACPRPGALKCLWCVLLSWLYGRSHHCIINSSL